MKNVTLCSKNIVHKISFREVAKELIFLLSGSSSNDDTGDRDVKLQRKKRKAGGGRCPFYKQSTIENLRDQALLKVLDIEELVSHGKKLGACPYYASRHATKDAQIIGNFFGFSIMYLSLFLTLVEIYFARSSSIQHPLAQADA